MPVVPYGDTASDAAADAQAAADSASDADRAAAEAAWAAGSASSADGAVACEALARAGLAVSTQQQIIRDRANYIATAARAVGAVSGTGRSDERAIGMIHTGLMAEASREMESANALDGAADEIAVALVSVCRF